MASSPTPPADLAPASGADPAVRARLPLRGRLAAALAARGLGPLPLGAIGLGAALLAAFALLVGHEGLAGVLGLLALAPGELATRPQPDGRRARVALAANLLVDLVLAGALVARATAEDSGLCVLLGLVLLGVFSLLPYLSALALPPGPGLWRRADRLAVLLLGLLLGTPLPAVLLVVGVGVLDAWHRAAWLARPEGAVAPLAAAPSFLAPLLKPDGTPHPAVRWGSLLIAVLLLALLPTASGWRF